MIETAILAPGAVLVAWSLLMLYWMAFTRLPAMRKAGVTMGAQPGGRGQDLEGVLDARTNWKAHNYAHLMEQPTIFYAAILILAVVGAADELSLLLAWAYVVLRIAHSIWQATVNSVPVRFTIFLLSTLCLTILAMQTLVATM